MLSTIVTSLLFNLVFHENEGIGTIVKRTSLEKHTVESRSEFVSDGE
jgi:hypothetical protein